jgi:hypothetical protein
LVSTPDIGAQLDAAIASPKDATSRALIQKLKRIMKIFNGMVPFTAAERKSKLGEFQAAMRMFGDPVFFNTLAPDSLAHVPGLRAAFDMSSNTGFPAEDGGFLDLISSDVIGVPRTDATAAFAQAHGLSAVAVRPDSLLQRLLHDPIAMALAFEEDVLFQQRYLNGHSFATDKNRKTPTREQLRKAAGVFGVCSAAAAVVECNGTFDCDMYVFEHAMKVPVYHCSLTSHCVHRLVSIGAGLARSRLDAPALPAVGLAAVALSARGHAAPRAACRARQFHRRVGAGVPDAGRARRVAARESVCVRQVPRAVARRQAVTAAARRERE